MRGPLCVVSQCSPSVHTIVYGCTLDCVSVCVCVCAYVCVCMCVCVYVCVLLYSRCKEPLLNLMDGLLRKVLMNFNLAELSDIDDDRLDDDVSD